MSLFPLTAVDSSPGQLHPSTQTTEHRGLFPIIPQTLAAATITASSSALHHILLDSVSGTAHHGNIHWDPVEEGLVLLEPPPSARSSRKNTGRLQKHQRKLRLHQGHMISPQLAESVCERSLLRARLERAAEELLDCWSEPESNVLTSPNLGTEEDV